MRTVVRTVVMHFSFNKNIGFYGRLEEDQLATSGFLQVREPRARAWWEQAQYG